ncbi:biotin/lipoyl-containing protein [Desulfofustis limnaeus]|jgi:biotin carboxyl carrier protein|uniref:Acetyl-CoA carboxylase biotin carboxyl carrier protein subunit n=1 Tax=Desulfofustis limnaeus TaxID=2740163 RepID=A0ABM7WBN9_9BACT|nr:biotin/lipoyl-containing protein [Desulfofustis limnaeus]BDD88365.1 acetyl-CoA carboxylase biotin carboxyl carrier protein subunit [Desulfofustis limnaeus]
MRRFRVVVNGSEFEVAIEELSGATGSGRPAVVPVSPAAAAAPASAFVPPRPAVQPAAGEVGAVVAQMPGTILEVMVAPGERVSRGQTLLLLEAMKMANEVVAPGDGVVVEVRVAKGASVNGGEVLVVLS